MRNKAAQVFCLLLGSISASAQTAAPIIPRGFTKSPTEHIINRLEQPLVVRSVAGTVVDPRGEPLEGVLFEAQGRGPDSTIKRCTSDKHGRFALRHLSSGTYFFKTTLNGFQSVIGSIVISKKAEKANRIKIEMKFGV